MVVAVAVALAVEKGDRVPVGGAVGEAAAEDELVEDAVAVPTAEVEAPPDRVPKEEVVAVTVTAVGVAPLDRVPVEEALPVPTAVEEPVGATSCVPVEEAVAVALPVVLAVALPVAEAVAVGEAPIPLSVILPKLILAVPVVSELEL